VQRGRGVRLAAQLRRSPCCGAAGASSAAVVSSRTSRRPSTPTRTWRTCCWRPTSRDAVDKAQQAWRRVVATATNWACPCPAFSGAGLLRRLPPRARLPANLLQAQRDYFGAHTYQRLYEEAIAQLGAAGLAEETCGPRRIVVEKPFGTNLETARRLNAKLHEVFAEHQVYRIDHYLGKETVQNLLVLRFANSIFEPLWNRNYVDHVQITVAEEVVVGGRGDYYDSSGVLRDMFQNHLLQLMTITAMEAPALQRRPGSR
jgi:hypothetical protein